MKVTFAQLMRAFATCDDSDTWIGGFNPDGSVNFVPLGGENPIMIGNTWFENVGVCLNEDGEGKCFHGQVFTTNINVYFEIVDFDDIPNQHRRHILAMNDEKTHALVVTDTSFNGLRNIYLSSEPEVTDLVYIDFNSTMPNHAGAVTEISAALFDGSNGYAEDLINLSIHASDNCRSDMDHIVGLRSVINQCPVLSHYEDHEKQFSVSLREALIELQEWILQAYAASTNPLAVRFYSPEAQEAFEQLYVDAGFGQAPNWIQIGVNKLYSKPSRSCVENPVPINTNMTVHSAYRATVYGHWLLASS